MASSIISPKEVRTAQARILENFMPDLRDRINKELQKPINTESICVYLSITEELFRSRKVLKPLLTEELQRAGWRVTSIKISNENHYQEIGGILEITMREPLENEKF